LHGGSNGFDQRVWNAEESSHTIDGQQAVGILFSRVSEDGEEGFPGRVEVQAGYFMTATSDIVFTWRAKLVSSEDLSSQLFPTPINLTNHAYWNLSGDFK